MLQFYKPNAKNTGCSCTFTFNTKDKSMFASLMRQFSWDSSKRRGSFAGNKENPQAKAAVKFSMTEAAGIIDSIDTNRPLSAYHTSSNQVTKIQFSPYIKDDKQLGFTLKVNREAKDDSTDKSMFLIGFNFSEACLLKEYISYGLRQCFISNEFKGEKPTKTFQGPGTHGLPHVSPESADFSPNNSGEDDEEIW